MAAPTSAGRRLRPGWARLARLALLLALAGLAGLLALLATAAWTARPWAFLAAGWAGFALAAAAAVRWGCVPRWRRAVWSAAVLAMSVLGLVALQPPGPVTMPPPAGVRRLGLAGGAHLAYLEIPAANPAHATPVIFLHGGPGMADMAGDRPYLRRLAAAGYDVYLYDQLGAGQSSRLADPSRYTLARGVADLNSFRRAIHARQVDLIGYSWGATLAAAYLAEHARHVGKVVFVSPGSMNARKSDLLAMLSRLDVAHLAALLRQVLAPRAALAWLLVQVNPEAAHAFAGDAEMDSRLRAMIAAVAPAFYCRPPPRPSTGHPGFYVLAMLLRPLASPGADLHAALARLATPALILRGQCDYVSRTSARDYRDTLARSRLIDLPGAGHRLFAERPRAFTAIVAAFLAGRALPLAAAVRSESGMFR
ncbi:MAG: alpha/beta fold hydrolase [Rhodospirillales bacterium]|nr:alpha/beta fold hydrolase [Rhodospirillales bacterium]